MKFEWNKIAGLYPLHWNRHLLIEEKKHRLKVALIVKIMPLAIKLLVMQPFLIIIIGLTGCSYGMEDEV